ncbi:MAG: AAA family ATPase, partial [Azospirillum sp.]|nr:AAA family ATPase [Azospirillum sp.]
MQLRGFEIGPKTAQKVANTWGAGAMTKLAANPWELYRDIDGIGFLTADKIAMSLGKRANDPNRLDAAMSYALDEATQEIGHMWISRSDLIARATEVLESTTAPIRPAEIEARFDPWQQFTKVKGGKYCVVVEVDGQQRIYPVPLWNAEKRIVEKVSELIVKAPTAPLATDEEIKAAMAASGLEEDASQFAALVEATHGGFTILTGKPGCGKTTITKTYLDLAEKKAARILCCSPTGKAADRFREATGRSASTIHSLLIAAEKKARENDGNGEGPGRAVLDCDILIVDECSMIDAKLMRQLLDALEPGTRVLFVGDADQLPPVDPGQPFADLISSGCVPTARLTTIHRQAANSGIIAAAHAILGGKTPKQDDLKPDFKYTKISEPRDEDEKRDVARAAADGIVRFVVDEIPKMHGSDGTPFNPIEDAMVLTPRKDGILGTKNLNKLLKEALNPSQPDRHNAGAFFKFKDWVLDIGDRVIHTKNNRELGVYNGNVGVVVGFDTDIDPDSGARIKVAVVKIADGANGRIVMYDKRTAGAELQLAYAITTHKSQGSEFKASIVLCAKEHWKLLERRLIYTALTRGKKFVHLFAQPY